MKRLLIAAIALAASLALSAIAHDAPAQTGKDNPAASTGGQLTEGEVRKVDKDAKKITIRHGPIQSLEMPAMTMVFQVKDPALLDKVQAGDKIKFSADKDGGAYIVNQLEIVK